MWLVPLFLAAAVIAIVCTYYMFGSMVSWFMDSQMQVLAESHTAETIGPPALRPLTAHHVEKGGLIVQIWDGQGALLTSSYPALAVPLQPADGFKELKNGSLHWRVYSVHTPGRTVQSIQMPGVPRECHQQAGAAGGIADRAADPDFGMASLVRGCVAPWASSRPSREPRLRRTRIRLSSCRRRMFLPRSARSSSPSTGC